MMFSLLVRTQWCAGLLFVGFLLKETPALLTQPYLCASPRSSTWTKPSGRLEVRPASQYHTSGRLPGRIGRSRTRRCADGKTIAAEADGSGAGAEDTSSADGARQRLQSAEDSDAPILYIKGLKQGGGVGIWDEENENGEAVGEGNAVRVAKAMRNAVALGRGEEVEEIEETEESEAEDEVPILEKIQMSLGLGTWSYVGLGLSVFIIFLNNFLGMGWMTRVLQPDFDTEGLVDVEQQRQQIQVMPLDDASNLLSS